MKEKRVAIDPSLPKTHEESFHSGQNTSVDGPIPCKNINLPRNQFSPGRDGYRTPTIEDHELHNNSSMNARHNATFSNNSSHVRLPHTPPLSLGRHSANPSSTSLAHSILDKIEWRQRIRHYTWTFFAVTMAWQTGGIANVLYTVPFRFRGLETIGVFFFLLNIVLFIFNVTMISLRFYYHPEMFKASILHPTERLFIPAAVVSFGTILLNISQYGPSRSGHWLNETVAICFWIDVALALLSSTGVYLVMWSTASFTIAQMTPIWIFPAYPLLIIGPHAGVLSQTVEQAKALNIIIGGFTVQGIGFLVSVTIYSAFIYRLMTQKLPQEASRPGMFVSVGPSGFTVAGILGMAEGAQRALPANFMGNTEMSALVLKVVAAWMSLWIWGLAIWFFFISVGAHWSCVGPNRMRFTMTWYSYVFPNTALITSTFAIGKAFSSKAIQILGCILTPILIAVWIVVVGMMIRAISMRQILWPQKGEDKDEGGFKGPRPARRTSV
ncbi:hypothetical protein ACLMJK_004581 [Lecanora helva]